MLSPVFSSFTFPSGLQVKNRIAKAAMEESMSDSSLLPTDKLVNLYSTWAKGGAGLLITGNVMIDRLAMTGPGGIALEKGTPLAKFRRWAHKARENNCKVWMQINHPGRQVFANLEGKVLSPSAIALDMGKHSKLFGQPEAMSDEQIEDVIQRFKDTASQAKEAGFDGIQIHAAHGYLLSQFLSPLVNKRLDKWGGELANRARLLIEVVKAVKPLQSKDFAIAVKLNSADFQKGGFEPDDAKQVVKLLEEFNIDLIELSGGSYEAPAMQGSSRDDKTLAREAYFLSFAKEIKQCTSSPIMTTGGIRRLPVAEQVLNTGIELVGIGTGLAMNPDLPNMWMQDVSVEARAPVVNWKNKTLTAMATMALVRRQIHRIGAGKKVKRSASPLFTLVKDQIRNAKLSKRYLANK